jgi:hypothetical protein
VPLLSCKTGPDDRRLIVSPYPKTGAREDMCTVGDCDIEEMDFAVYRPDLALVVNHHMRVVQMGFIARNLSHTSGRVEPSSRQSMPPTLQRDKRAPSRGNHPATAICLVIVIAG